MAILLITFKHKSNWIDIVQKLDGQVMGLKENYHINREWVNFKLGSKIYYIFLVWCTYLLVDKN